MILEVCKMIPVAVVLFVVLVALGGCVMAPVDVAANVALSV